ncbi:nucleoside transporter 1 [Plasmodium yoelii]|uniref:Nucleoside transporter 1 n=2 Tax=Plasmodium yoelii TaxID=5861 RepID=A0AAE9WWR4_PLAYO|nr:nucleoside transporter 1 [Plasmodium yoelii]WBY60396.1 nucleoside transporter 1 [Plasmodium yoelii yoelii]CDU20268.1 nucleoside transporter 1 [Plasmodium yoelii]VTZ81026.1 nucleoside transporter 1 [Plasmodium yoelii]|eukprot:XP_022813752.1 nucleoside transporter 1 [Plasmodium yoelii]
MSKIKESSSGILGSNNTNKESSKKNAGSIALPITYALIGVSCLNVWNSALGLNIKIKYNIFQMAGLLTSSVLALFVNYPRVLLPSSLGVLTLLCAGFQIAHQTFSDSAFDTYCLAAFITIGLMAGIAQTIAFAIGTTKESNMSGYISAGIGMSGVLIFCINLALDYIVSEAKKYGINKSKLLILFSVSEIFLIVTIVCCVLYIDLFPKNDNNKDSTDIEKAEEKEGRLSLIEILKDGYKAILSIFLVNWLSLQLFPGIGHKKWQESHGMTDNNVTIIVGMFQVFDFISRYPPNFTHIKIFKYFTFSLNTLLIANFLRLLLIPWFVLNAAVSNPFFTNIVQQCICMATLAFTNGWFNTVPFIVFVKELKKVKHQKDIETISRIMVVSLFFGLFFGMLTTCLYDYFPIVISKNQIV